MPDSDKRIREGVVSALIAYLVWGCLPVYFTIVAVVNPFEVLSHRILWAIPFGALIIAFRGQWPEIARALQNRQTLTWLMASALLIAINWLIYIVAIGNGRIIDTSLGYYINPILNMVFGVALFGERLRRLQAVAVALAFAGVMILIVKGGQVPWVSLGLAFSFGAYGIIRKKVVIGGMPGLFIETLVLAPFAVACFVWLGSIGQISFASQDMAMSGWLILAGPVTAVPLLFFALAARRLPLTTIGFMQFLAPSMQFAIGVYYGEPLTAAYIACFVFIWLAVVFFVSDAISTSKKKPLKV